jgi:signal transduction histidine kinase
MDPVANIFQQNILVIYFFYGLAFFCMGLLLWIESGRTSEFRIARAIGALAGFGIIHGLHEWFEMFQLLAKSGATDIPDWLLLNEVRLAHLVVSFLLLLIFGVRLIHANRWGNGRERRFAYLTAGSLFAIWQVTALITKWAYDLTGDDFLTVMDVLARYMIGIPASLLAAWAIILEQRSFHRRGMSGFGRDLQWAAWALLLYGVVGQVFTTESVLFPSTIINADLFFRTFGIPIQFFRAMEAALMAVFMVRALRAFELEQKQRLVHANDARLSAQREALLVQQAARYQTEQLYSELQEREELLAKLLHQVVKAQENERQRVARELHDGAGQILTGLGLGLAAASESLKTDPDLTGKQLAELRQLNAQALEELQFLIRDLRPSVLDDMGLVPALKAQVREFEHRTGVSATFTVEGKPKRLMPELETVAFRIGQEALTNIAKHAQAQHVDVKLSFNANCMKLVVQDDGRGFDPDAVSQTNGRRQAWGLLGIQERVNLVGGICFIISEPGAGTTVRATIPLTIKSSDHVEDSPPSS